MFLTVFLAIVFCAAITIMLISAVVFIQDKKLCSSAPKEALDLLMPRTEELFFGARKMGWALMAISVLMILGVGAVSAWDGFRCGFTFLQFFTRFLLIFTIYKAYDMIFFDWFLLCRFRFFQHFYTGFDDNEGNNSTEPGFQGNMEDQEDPGGDQRRGGNDGIQ